ncbi:MAG TPA: MBL fold metallo-hydrolase [Bryobacteraceae bacterium]|nr:MBL fold metallo-hydrolase [Bryobacteraceae bacterium]
MSDASWRLKLKFWGVRGSIATPVSQNLGYGGNTPCLEVRLPSGELFIFDAGTGIRELGSSLNENPADAGRDIHLFLTHFHWDHIQGLPFFAPLYDPRRAITFYTSCHACALRESLAGQMSEPFFPVSFDSIAPSRKFVNMGSAPITLGELTVRPFPLNHPQGAGGYRIESGGAAIVYATDREHGHERLDAALREYARDADILIHDAQYTPEEYERFKGYGHSTWEEAVKVACECNIKQLVLFHHDPNHDDRVVSAIVEKARTQFPRTEGAREACTFTI